MWRGVLMIAALFTQASSSPQFLFHKEFRLPHGEGPSPVYGCTGDFAGGVCALTDAKGQMVLRLIDMRGAKPVSIPITAPVELKEGQSNRYLAASVLPVGAHYLIGWRTSGASGLFTIDRRGNLLTSTSFGGRLEFPVYDEMRRRIYALVSEAPGRQPQTKRIYVFSEDLRLLFRSGDPPPQCDVPPLCSLDLGSYGIVSPRVGFSHATRTMVLYARTREGNEPSTILVIDLAANQLHTFRFPYDCNMKRGGRYLDPDKDECFCVHCAVMPTTPGRYFVARSEVLHEEIRGEKLVLAIECQVLGSECVLTQVWRFGDFPDVFQYFKESATRRDPLALRPLIRQRDRIVIPYTNFFEVKVVGFFGYRIAN